MFLISLGLIFCWLQQGCTHTSIRNDAPIASPEAIPTPVPVPTIEDSNRGYIKYLPDETSDLDRAIRVKRIEVIVNQIVQGSCIEDELQKVQKFNETKDSPNLVLSRLRRVKIDAIVSYYKSKNPWSSAVAYAEGNTLYFNTRQIGAWTDCDFASTGLHEASHMAPLEYGHDFNYYSGRELTVPYWLNTVVDRCCK
jgi:hypothetical protein